MPRQPGKDYLSPVARDPFVPYSPPLLALRGLTGMVIASTASNVITKGLVRRPRPAGEVPRDRRPGRTPVTTSFPSGHAAAAAAFATGVGLEMAALAAPVGALAAAVGLSRVVNGVHYPTDIAGGWVVGVGVGMLTLRWWPLRQSQPAAASATSQPPALVSSVILLSRPGRPPRRAVSRQMSAAACASS